MTATRGVAVDHVPASATQRAGDGGWRDEAACRGADTDLFIATNSRSGGSGGVTFRGEPVAKAYCQTCNVVVDCLLFALATRDSYSILGGLTPAERRKQFGRWP